MNALNAISCPEWYQDLIQPVPGGNPCGESLEYDADFIMLQSRLQPRAGAEYGHFIETPDPLNWAEIERDTRRLLTRSRDIRLIIVLIRCRLRVIGTEALAEGLAALYALLVTWPEALHPQLSDEGVFDPLIRANALTELDAPDGLLADLRQQMLPKAAGLQLSVHDVERAIQTPEAEGVLSGIALAAIKQNWLEQQAPAILALQQAWNYLQQLIDHLSEYLGMDTPLFSGLKGLLKPFIYSDCAEPTHKYPAFS
mgnify:CR=1 FL=1